MTESDRSLSYVFRAPRLPRKLRLCSLHNICSGLLENTRNLKKKLLPTFKLLVTKVTSNQTDLLYGTHLLTVLQHFLIKTWEYQFFIYTMISLVISCKICEKRVLKSRFHCYNKHRPNFVIWIEIDEIKLLSQWGNYNGKFIIFYIT